MFCVNFDFFRPCRPDKIDFNSLKKEEPIKNLNIAFECAEQEFDIPPLLDAPGIIQFKQYDVYY